VSAVRPDKRQIEDALAAADRMRELGVDPHGLALSLHYLAERCAGLESLLELVDRYLRFGMPDNELTRLRVVVDRLREQEDNDDSDETLPI
jgi:hypothetical protein